MNSFSKVDYIYKNNRILYNCSNIYIYIFFPTEKPSFRRFPIDVTTREKKTVEFPCDVVGDKPLQVTWRKEHGNIGRISTLRDHTLRIEDVSRHDSGIYVCVAKNQVGEAEAVARLNVECK